MKIIYLQPTVFREAFEGKHGGSRATRELIQSLDGGRGGLVWVPSSAEVAAEETDDP